MTVLGALFIAGPAFADDPQAETRGNAYETAQEGLKAYESGDFRAAYDLFEQAERQFHAPTLVLHMARSKNNLRELMRARALYEQVAAEPVAYNAPAAHRQAQDSAKIELEALRPRIPAIQIVVTGAEISGVRISLDAVPLSPGVLQGKLELDPGKHTLIVWAPGTNRVEREIEIEEGTVERVAIDLGSGMATQPTTALLPAPRPRPSPSSSPPPKATPRDTTEPFPWATGFAFGVGGLGVGVGIVAGVVALSSSSDLVDACPDKTCRSGDQALADSARSASTVSTVAFSIGGAAIAAGVLLVFVDGPAPLSAQIGADSITLKGKF